MNGFLLHVELERVRGACLLAERDVRLRFPLFNALTATWSYDPINTPEHILLRVKAVVPDRDTGKTITVENEHRVSAYVVLRIGDDELRDMLWRVMRGVVLDMCRHEFDEMCINDRGERYTEPHT